MPVSVLALAALAQPTAAEAALTPILIPQLQLGMQKEQVKAIWPRMAASFGNGCMVKIEGGYRRGDLEVVTLRPTGRDKGGACMKLVTEWAYTYGKPTSEYGIPPNAGSCLKGHYGGLGPMSEDPGCETSPGTHFTRWETPQLTLVLKVSGDDWSVTASR